MLWRNRGGIMKAGRALFKKFKSRPRSSRSASYGNTTFQRDEATIYRRKRAPRRVRRAHRRSFKRFMFMSDKLLGMKTCVINDQFTSGVLTPTSFSNGQFLQTITMYGCDPTGYVTNGDTQNGDLYWIFSRENGGVPTLTDASRKLRFRSAVLDFRFHNDSADQMLCLDIYYVLARKSTTISGNFGSDAGRCWNNMIGAQEGTNMPNAIANAGYYGVTPFDAPGFGRYWLIKKKRRVQMSPGQWTTFQMRDPGNYLFDMEQLLAQGSIPNVTEGIMVCAWNPDVDPTGGAGGIPLPLPVSYSYTCVKTYHYCENVVSQDQIGGEV